MLARRPGCASLTRARLPGASMRRGAGAPLPLVGGRSRTRSARLPQGAGAAASGAAVLAGAVKVGQGRPPCPIFNRSALSPSPGQRGGLQKFRGGPRVGARWSFALQTRKARALGGMLQPWFLSQPPASRRRPVRGRRVFSQIPAYSGPGQEGPRSVASGAARLVRGCPALVAPVARPRGAAFAAPFCYLRR